MKNKIDYLDSKELNEEGYILLAFVKKEQAKENDDEYKEKRVFNILNGYYNDSEKRAGESLKAVINHTNQLEFKSYNTIVKEITQFRTISNSGSIAIALTLLKNNGLLLYYSKDKQGYYKQEPDFNDKLKELCNEANKYIDAYNNDPFTCEEDFYSKLGIEETKIDEIINDINIKNKVQDKDYDSSIIKLNKKLLIDYIKNAIDIEGIIYSLKERYYALNHRIQHIIERHLIDECFNTSLLTINRKIDLEKIINSKEEKKEPKLDDFIEKNCPHKPVFDLEEPVKPSIKKSLFFNKKKIKDENIKMFEEYEKELKKYEEKKKDFLIDTKEYEKELENHKKEAYKQYEIALKEYKEEQKNKDSNKIEQEKELNDLKNDTENNIMKLLEENENFIKVNSMAYEMNYIIIQLEKYIKIRNEIYSYNVIYNKYRNIIALSSFMDYLMSSRCETLEGNAGAYNIFEQESRADIIINKLDTVIQRLDQISDNQYYIYNKLNEINETLRVINSQLLVSNMLQTVEVNKLDEVINNTKLIAYNTEVTAYYSKQISKYTEILTYLNFLALK